MVLRPHSRVSIEDNGGATRRAQFISGTLEDWKNLRSPKEVKKRWGESPSSPNQNPEGIEATLAPRASIWARVPHAESPHRCFDSSGCASTHSYHDVHASTFDDGKPLGSHNTQQHWFTIGDGLFLLYTRKGADNDHIFRHRAPLFIGQVNPETLQVMRATERILLKENHAGLGNSGVCQVSENEGWVTCSENSLSCGKRKDDLNNVFITRIQAKF